MVKQNYSTKLVYQEALLNKKNGNEAYESFTNKWQFTGNSAYDNNIEKYIKIGVDNVFWIFSL